MISAEALKEQLERKVMVLTRKLEASVADKLTGALLQKRSGKLLSSIQSDVWGDGDTITGLVSSADVPYAALLEYGGKTAAHDIAAVKTKALAFVTAAGSVFAKSVHHPGSRIPAFGYLSNSLSELEGEIISELKQTVLDALGEN